MKKILFLCICSLLLSACSVFGGEGIENPEKVAEVTEETSENTEQQELSQEEKNNKIALLRKKIKLKGLITSGDMYFQEDNHFAAILSYQKALKDIPNDQKLNKKIADAYYEIHNYKKATEYYAKVKEYETLDTDQAIKSLVNANNVNPGNISKLKKEIQSYNLSPEKEFYYDTALDCVIDFSKCREEFENYFSEHPNITDKNLINIKKALTNFENFGHTELYYKASFVSGAFYENAFYFLSLKTAEKILAEKRDYKPMLKVAAKSSYEIGEYELAKEYLLQNKKLDSHDYEVSYFLARIYEKLGDVPLALVHYQKSIKDGNPDLKTIYMRIIFIYFEQDNMEKMLAEFDTLMELPDQDLTETDFSLAIYYNILSEKFIQAKKYAKRGTEVFPDNEIFYAYTAWIMLQDDNISSIEFKVIKKNIEKAHTLNSKNPTVLMVEGIYEYKQKNYKESLIYLKNAGGLDKTGDYSEEILYWLDLVEEEMK